MACDKASPRIDSLQSDATLWQRTAPSRQARSTDEWAYNNMTSFLLFKAREIIDILQSCLISLLEVIYPHSKVERTIRDTIYSI